MTLPSSWYCDWPLSRLFHRNMILAFQQTILSCRCSTFLATIAFRLKAIKTIIECAHHRPISVIFSWLIVAFHCDYSKRLFCCQIFFGKTSFFVLLRVKSFVMDINERMKKESGDFGPYQFVMLGVFCFINIVASIHYYTQTIILFVPQHWWVEANSMGVDAGPFAMIKNPFFSIFRKMSQINAQNRLFPSKGTLSHVFFSRADISCLKRSNSTQFKIYCINFPWRTINCEKRFEVDWNF